MEFAWNTQKNKITDIKGKEFEQDRLGKISNEEIDLNKTYKNYDLVSSDLNLYQRVKKRIDDVRENSRIQKNSVVCYSNIVTVNKETFKEWGEDKSKKYLESVYQYFCNEFGHENVISAKVHLDETTPHMHLHFVPVSSEGKLQARKVMTPSRINKIHSDAVKWLQAYGFDVQRGKGETGKKNIKDIHKYKSKKLIEEIEELELKKNTLKSNIEKFLNHNIDDSKDLNIDNVDIKNTVFSKDKVIINKQDLDDILNAYDELNNINKYLKTKLIDLDIDNENLMIDIKKLKTKEKDLLDERKYLMKKQETLRLKENHLKSKENEIKFKENDLQTMRDSTICKLKKQYFEEIEIKNKKIKELVEDNNFLESSIERRTHVSSKLRCGIETDRYFLDLIMKKQGNEIFDELKNSINHDKLIVRLSSDNNTIEPKSLYRFNKFDKLYKRIKKLSEHDILRYDICIEDSMCKLHTGTIDTDSCEDFYKYIKDEYIHGFFNKEIITKAIEDIEILRFNKANVIQKEKVNTMEHRNIKNIGPSL